MGSAVDAGAPLFGGGVRGIRARKLLRAFARVLVCATLPLACPAVASALPGSDLEVSVAASNSVVESGSSASVTFVVRNYGPDVAPSPRLVMPSPPGTVIVSASTPAGSCLVIGSTAECDLGALAPSASTTVSTTYDPGPSVGPRRVTASAPPDGDPSVTNNATAATFLVVPVGSADVSATVFLPYSIYTGMTGSVTATLRNAGPADAIGAQIVVALPGALAKLSFSAPADMTCSETPSAVTCVTNAPLAPGQARILSVAVQGTGAATGSSTATASSTTADPVPGNDLASANTYSYASPNLIFDVYAPTLAVDQAASMRVRVYQRSPAPGPVSTLSFTVPANVVLTGSVPAGCSAAGASVTCSVTWPTSQYTATELWFSVRGVSASVSSTPVTLTTPGDSNTANDIATLTLDVLAADAAGLDLAIVAPSVQPVAGQPMTLAVTARNTGPGIGDGEAFSVMLPAGLTGMTSVASGGSCTTFGSVLSCWTYRLGPGESVRVDVTGTPSMAGPLSFSASAPPASSYDGNNQASNYVWVNPAAGWWGPAAGVPRPVLRGSATANVGAAQYVFTYLPGYSDTNSYTNPTVQVNVPAAATVTGVSPSSGSCTTSGQTITCSTATPVTPSQAFTVLVAATAPPGTHSATATATVDPGTSTSVSAGAIAWVPEPGVPDLVLGATTVWRMETGQRVTQRFTVANRGRADADGVSLVVHMPTNLSFVAGTPTQGTGCVASAGDVTCDLATLYAASSASIDIVVDAGSGGRAVISADVSSVTAGDRSTGDWHGSWETEVTTGGTDMYVWASDNGDPVPGESSTVYIGTRNYGSTSVSGVVLTYQVPSGAIVGTLTDPTGACALAGNSMTCAFGTLGSRATAEVELVLTYPDIGTYLHLAQVTSSASYDWDESDNVVAEYTWVYPPTYASTNLYGAGAMRTNDGLLAYRFYAYATNYYASATPAEDSVATFTLPLGMTLTRASADDGTCTLAGQQLRCVATRPLRDNVIWPIEIVGTAAAAGSYTVSGTLSTSTVQNHHWQTHAQQTIYLPTAPVTADLNVWADWPWGLFSPGDVVQTEAVVGVTNGAIAPGTSVTFTMPPSLQWVDSTWTNACSQSGSLVTCAVGDLGPGTNVSVPISVRLLSAGRHEIVVGASSSLPDPDGAADTIAINAGTIYADPDWVRFAAVPVGSTSHATVEVEGDWGLLPVTFGAMTITGPASADFAIDNNSCAGAVRNDQVCAVALRFTPSATGERSATLHLNDDSREGPITVELVGDGGVPIPMPRLTSDRSVVDFGRRNVTTVATQQVPLRNTGTAPLTFGAPTISGPDAAGYTAAVGSCPLVLPAGASCAMQVTFTPSTAGGQQATLHLASDDPRGPVTLSLLGTGHLPSSVLRMSSTTLDFGAVRVASSPDPTRTVTATNIGDAPLVFGAIALGGGDATRFLISADTCTTLQPGESCAVTVAFSTSQQGTFAASLDVPSNALDAPHSVLLSARAALPLPTPSPASVDFGMVPRYESAPRTVTITNDGDGPMTLTMTRTGPQASWYFLGGNSCTNVAPASSCSVSVYFNPQGRGTGTATLALDAGAPTTTRDVALTGFGGTPLITVAPSPLAFGDVSIGSAAVRSVTVTNTGETPLRVSNAWLSQNNGWSVVSNTCASVDVPAGGTCEIAVRFTASATGAFSSQLTLPSNAYTQASAVALTANGVAPGLGFDVGQLAYGGRLTGTTTDRSTTVTNVGGAPLTVSAVQTGGSASSSFIVLAESCTTSGSLPPGGTCSVTVRYAPVAIGTHNAQLLLISNATGSPHALQLSGSAGAPQPALQHTPVTLDYGSVPRLSQAERIVTINNTGSADLTVSSVGMYQSGTGFSIGSSTCGTPVPAGSTCEITVRFAPVSSGARTDQLRFSTNAPGAVTLQVPVSGTGTAPNISFTPASATFGGRLVGATADTTVTLQNAGQAPLNVSAITITGTSAAQFAIIAEACTTAGAIAPGATCAITLRHAPTAAGSHTASLRVTSDAPASPTFLSLSASAGVPRPDIQLSTTWMDFGDVEFGASTDRSLTVTNNGTAALNISNTSLTQGPAPEKWSIASNACTQPLAPAASCTIVVRLSAIQHAYRAEQYASLVITSDAQSAIQSSIYLTGILVGPHASWTTNDQLGTVYLGEFKDQSITLRNDGGVSLMPNVGFDPPLPSLSIVGGTCGAALAPGASCNYLVRLQPTSTGNVSSRLKTNDPDDPSDLGASIYGWAAERYVPVSDRPTPVPTITTASTPFVIPFRGAASIGYSYRSDSFYGTLDLELRYRQVASDGTSSAIETKAERIWSSSGTVQVPARSGASLCIYARTTYRGGTGTSEWSPEQCSPVAWAAASLRRAGRWSANYSAALENALTTYRRGATMTTRNQVRGTQAVLTAVSSRYGGKVEVFLGNRRIKRINLTRRGSDRAVQIPLWRSTTPRSGVVKIRVTSNSKNVTIGALAVW